MWVLACRVAPFKVKINVLSQEIFLQGKANIGGQKQEEDAERNAIHSLLLEISGSFSAAAAKIITGNL